MSYPAYPEYKESGLHWLGKTPTHWRVSALKRGFEVALGKMLQPEQKAASEELLPYLRAANIQPVGVSLDQLNEMWFTPSERQHLQLQLGDLLISEGGDVGRPAIWHHSKEVLFQNSINRVRPLNGNSNHFLYYWILAVKEKGYIDVLCNKATIAHFTAEKVASVPTPFPPPCEQTQIARFLDHQTARIDALIAEQQRLIELLKEKRQAVISHAVTKGLDRDVAMKDSGVEWLGEVPAHWHVASFKRLLVEPLKYGANETADEANSEHPRFVRITDVTADGSLRDETFRSLSPEVAAPYLLREGDILLARSGATVGKAFIYQRSWGKCCFAGYLVRARIDQNKGCPMFVYSVLQSSHYWQFIGQEQTQATIQNVSADRYENFVLAVPPIVEQRQIIDDLDEKLKNFKSLLQEADKSIMYLQERRSALITAAVTGKIDVRDWEPPASETFPQSTTSEETPA